MEAVSKAGYQPGKDIGFALDVASSEFFKDGKYVFEGEGRTFSTNKKAGKKPKSSSASGSSPSSWC